MIVDLLIKAFLFFDETSSLELEDDCSSELKLFE
jgi:hypothetical protein